MENESLKKYEITYVVKEENSAPIKDILEKHGAEILDDRPLEKIRLAYPIAKQEYGFLGTIVFAIDPGKTEAIAPDLKLEEGLIRNLITALTAEQSSAENKRKSANAAAARRRKITKEKKPGLLTNEALEKKIEEILQ